MGEEWSAGVREQNFELIVPAPEHEQTSVRAVGRLQVLVSVVAPA
jgi:hypothetical protein